MKSKRKSVVAVPKPNNPTPILPEALLVDVQGAARIMSTTVWTVRSLLWAKKIPHIKIGRKFLIDPADLREFIQRLKAA